MADTPVVLLNGARQTGKATEAQAVAAGMEILPLYPFSAGELAGVPEGFLPRLFAGTVAGSKPPSANGTIAPFGDRLWLVPLPALWAL